MVLPLRGGKCVPTGSKHRRGLAVEVLEDRIVPAHPNLIVNGDFEAGNTGFTSDFGYDTALNYGTYAITRNPRTNTNWAASFADHTTGTGNLLAANGAQDPTVIWRQTDIAVLPDHDYTFSVYVASLHVTSPAYLRLRISGALVNTVDQRAPAVPGVWQRLQLTWNSGSATSADIEFIDLNTATEGNDFALDDIEFRQVDPGVTVTPSGGSTSVTEGGPGDAYAVVLNSQPAGIGSVTVTVHGNPQVVLSTTTLVFDYLNWDVPQTVTVTAVDDHRPEPTRAISLTHSLTGTDTAFLPLVVDPVAVTVFDDDIPGVIVTESNGSTDVAEAGSTDSYTVVLATQPAGLVTVSLSPDKQVHVSASSLVFDATNWATPQTVVVSAVDDAAIEGDHAGIIKVSVTSGDADYRQLSVASVAAHITDNDFGALVFQPALGALDLLEGGSRSYRVSLNAAPTSDVTVDLAPSDPELTLSVTRIVFTSTDWNQPRVVLATIADNSQRDGDRAHSINHTFQTTDPKYLGSVASLLPVNVADDENRLIVNGTDGSDQISVTFSATWIQVVVNRKSTFYSTASANYSQVLVLAGDGNNTVTIANPVLPVTYLGGAGVDRVQILGRPAANTFDVDGTAVTVNAIVTNLLGVEHLVLGGHAGADSFTLTTLPTATLQVQGGGGTDRLVGPDQSNLWKITAANSGTLGSSVSFAAVENLVGGASDDRFVFGTGRAVSGTVDGGGGTNSLDLSAYKSTVSVRLTSPFAGSMTGTGGFAAIASITSGSGNDKLSGPNSSNLWDITGRNAGNLAGLSFAGFENLTGGASDDRFAFAAGALLTGKIDGGAGSDRLDFSALAVGVTVNLQSKTATNTGGWLNLEQFVGSTGNDKLIAANKANTWNLTGVGTGTITGGYGFQDFENLTGGTLADAFVLALTGDWLGQLDGGSGLDTLTSATGGVYTPSGPNAGTLNGHSFKNVERYS